ncbi:MAG: IclR family transcriptional regulator C-terminal domain-containing protein [Candidatus Lokiarchaeota archaeon]|nr:IclR family transcriptional regulator C-terminal domain-containing protein [Candidatus Lokiarchaeota archaeon]
MEKEFLKIRKQSYAVDNMEHEEGVRCVAGPIRDYTGKVIASMSISGPAFRINESNILDIAKKLKNTVIVFLRKWAIVTTVANTQNSN